MDSANLPQIEGRRGGSKPIMPAPALPRGSSYPPRSEPFKQRSHGDLSNDCESKSLKCVNISYIVFSIACDHTKLFADECRILLRSLTCVCANEKEPELRWRNCLCLKQMDIRIKDLLVFMLRDLKYCLCTFSSIVLSEMDSLSFQGYRL